AHGEPLRRPRAGAAQGRRRRRGGAAIAQMKRQSDSTGSPLRPRRRAVKFDPGRRVVARLLPAAHAAVDARRVQTCGGGRAEQKVIDAQAGVARVSVPKIVPKGVDALAGMKGAQSVGPTLRDQAAKGFANLDAEQGVIDPSLRLV